jgi:DNA mismatch endonuclease (patch repair protein)
VQRVPHPLGAQTRRRHQLVGRDAFVGIRRDQRLDDLQELRAVALKPAASARPRSPASVGLSLERLQIPIVFAICRALVALVATKIGAGHAARAKRIASARRLEMRISDFAYTKSMSRARKPSAWGRVPARVSARMAKVRSHGTAPELRLIEFVTRRGLRFSFHADDLPGRPDVVFRRRKVAVFVHGCFWHGHTGCPRAKLPQTNPEKWRLKMESNTRRDRRVSMRLRSQGWSVLTVWECRMRDKDLRQFYARLTRKFHRI